MVHASASSFEFRRKRATWKHGLIGVFIFNLNLLGYTENCLIWQIGVFVTVFFLVFGFHKIFSDEVCHRFSDLGFVSISRFQDLGQSLAWVLANALNVVWKVVKPHFLKFFENGFAFLWKSAHKVSTCQTGTVSYRPRLIFEAVNESGHQVLNIWFKWLRVFTCYFATELRNAVTCGFSDGVVVSTRLWYVKRAYFLGILANNISALLAMDLFPSVIWVNLDPLSNIVSIQAHPWD